MSPEQEAHSLRVSETASFSTPAPLSTGVISALNRSIRSDQRVFHGFLQTDASINPGNSGGPLVNAEGKLIAINTAVHNGGQGIGFAIPIDIAKRVVDELITHGEITPVWLGLDFQDLDPDLSKLMDLPSGVGGALVNRVRKDSPADHSDLRRGDVVPSKYIKQMQWQMACTGRKWVDFVSYDPRMPENMRLFIMRVDRDDDLIGDLETAVRDFEGELVAMITKLQATA